MQLDTPRSEDAGSDRRPGADLTGCLNQAVESGDADMVGQAWQAVRQAPCNQTSIPSTLS